jgi:hypothetical protein
MTHNMPKQPKSSNRKVLDASKAAFYISGYLEELGRALMVVGADFSNQGAWLTEAYVLFANPKLSDGVRVLTSYDALQIPADMLPTPDYELNDRVKFAESMFWHTLRDNDLDLAFWLKGSGSPFTGPLTEHGLARVHLRGEFGDQIVDILRFTECEAIRNVLHKLDGFPKFKTKTERDTA